MSCATCNPGSTASSHAPAYQETDRYDPDPDLAAGIRAARDGPRRPYTSARQWRRRVLFLSDRRHALGGAGRRAVSMDDARAEAARMTTTNEFGGLPANDTGFPPHDDRHDYRGD